MKPVNDTLALIWVCSVFVSSSLFKQWTDSPPPAKKAKVAENVQIKLVYEPGNKKKSRSKFKALDKPVLTLPTNATILHLKKFIKQELKLDDIASVSSTNYATHQTCLFTYLLHRLRCYSTTKYWDQNIHSNTFLKHAAMVLLLVLTSHSDKSSS